MLVSHTIKVLFPEQIPHILPWSFEGFPLFALAFAYTTKVGYRGGFNRKLLFWAILAQVPFTLCFGFRLNILFAFLWALLPIGWAIPAAFTVGYFTDGSVFGVLLLVFARFAEIPKPAQLPFRVPRAKAYPALYALHLAVLAFLAH